VTIKWSKRPAWLVQNFSIHCAAVNICCEQNKRRWISRFRPTVLACLRKFYCYGFCSPPWAVVSVLKVVNACLRIFLCRPTRLEGIRKRSFAPSGPGQRPKSSLAESQLHNTHPIQAPMLTFHCNDFIILRPFVAMLALRCDIFVSFVAVSIKNYEGSVVAPHVDRQLNVYFVIHCNPDAFGLT